MQVLFSQKLLDDLKSKKISDAKAKAEQQKLLMENQRRIVAEAKVSGLNLSCVGFWLVPLIFTDLCLDILFKGERAANAETGSRCTSQGGGRGPSSS